MCAHHADSTSVPARLTKNIWVFHCFGRRMEIFHVNCEVLRATTAATAMAISVDPRLLLCWSAEIKVEQILLWELPQNLLGGREPIHNVGKSRFYPLIWGNLLIRSLIVIWYFATNGQSSHKIFRVNLPPNCGFANGEKNNHSQYPLVILTSRW